MQRTWIYFKKIKEQKKSFWDIFIFGLFFEIAWIIPGIDIFSFITPICEKTNPDLPLPFQIIQLFIYPILDFFIPCVLSPFLEFITRINTFYIVVFVILSAIISVLYIFLHCKIYNVVLKRFLNPDKDLKIKELYAEKTDYLKKYYNWEFICFGIKFLISLPIFIWSLSSVSSVDFSSFGNLLIAIIFCLVFSLFNLYIILTRAFVIPVFMSGKYQEINSKNIFELSKKIFSINLIVPILIIATVYIFANILVLCGTVALFVISFKYISLFILNLLLWILGVVILSIFTYYVGLFCLSYCISCQESIFPDCPLILTKVSEEGNREEVYSVFEKD